MEDLSFDKKLNKKRYNPNRVNAFDGALGFIIALALFFALPYIIDLTLKKEIYEIYKYDTYLYMIINLMLSQACIFLVALFISLLRRSNPFSGGGFTAKFDGVQVLMAMLMIMGVMMTFYYVHLQLGNDADYILGTSSDIEEHTSPYSALFMIAYIILTALVPAIVEEMLFRGIIMRGFMCFGELFAVIISAIMFSLMHGSFSQMLLQFIGGIAIGGVVMITKNWLLGSIMHLFNNIFSVIFGILITPLKEGILNEYISTLFDGACIVIGVVCLIISVVYFGSMLIDREKKKAIGKPLSTKYDAVKYYTVRVEDGEPFTLPHTDVQPLATNKGDQRRFLFGKKFIKFNRESGKVITYIAIAIGILFAFISILV